MSSTLIAEVNRIEEIQAHPDPETTRLELARVKNWWCVVKKGDFQPGELCVYIPPGTVVPVEHTDRWGITNYTSELPARGDGTRPPERRIRAARLRGVASRGVMMKPEDASWPEGFSVVEFYGLAKYEPPPVVNDGEALPPHEEFHKYTDIESYGNFPTVFEDGEEVVVEEKIHGKNCRVGLVRDCGTMHFMAGSHNQRVKEVSDSGVPSSFWIPLEDRRLRSLLHRYLNDAHDSVIVFCEIFGRKMQDMEYGQSGVSYRAYDICIDGRYLDYDEKSQLFNDYGIEMPPQLYRGPFSDEKMNDLVDGNTLLCSPADAGRFKGREGIVIRPVKERVSPLCGRAILKLVSVDYEERKGVKTEHH